MDSSTGYLPTIIEQHARLIAESAKPRPRTPMYPIETVVEDDSDGFYWVELCCPGSHVVSSPWRSGAAPCNKCEPFGGERERVEA